MDPHDDTNEDDQFILLLERYHEVLRVGGEVDPSFDSSLSPQLQERLRRALRCLRFLRQVPPSFMAAATVVLTAGIS